MLSLDQLTCQNKQVHVIGSKNMGSAQQLEDFTIHIFFTMQGRFDRSCPNHLERVGLFKMFIPLTSKSVCFDYTLYKTDTVSSKNKGKIILPQKFVFLVWTFPSVKICSCSRIILKPYLISISLQKKI